MITLASILNSYYKNEKLGKKGSCIEAEILSFFVSLFVSFVLSCFLFVSLFLCFFVSFFLPSFLSFVLSFFLSFFLSFYTIQKVNPQHTLMHIQYSTKNLLSLTRHSWSETDVEAKHMFGDASAR